MLCVLWSFSNQSLICCLFVCLSSSISSGENPSLSPTRNHGAPDADSSSSQALEEARPQCLSLYLLGNALLMI